MPLLNKVQLPPASATRELLQSTNRFAIGLDWQLRHSGYQINRCHIFITLSLDETKDVHIGTSLDHVSQPTMKW